MAWLLPPPPQKSVFKIAIFYSLWNFQVKLRLCLLKQHFRYSPSPPSLPSHPESPGENHIAHSVPQSQTQQTLCAILNGSEQ